MFNKLFNFQGSKKSYYSGPSLSMIDIFRNDFSNPCSVKEFIDYYIKNSPVFTATKLIADSASSIEFLIKDENKDEFIYDHPALELLKKPNPFISGSLFIKELIGYYILTGNSYLSITGSSKPVELANLNPINITIQPSLSDGYPQDYYYNSGSKAIRYNRNDKKQFVASNSNELCHLRQFNPNYGSNNLYGLSTFQGVGLEISQYLLASIHNNSLIKNQGRPSGLISFTGDESAISEEQALKIQEQIQNKLQGAANAGRPLFLSGKFNWQQLSESVKDMDFNNLKKTTAEAIFNAAKIPLPMVSPDNMTLANMDAAKYNFYDNCIIPVVKDVQAFLTKNLLSRYPNSENLRFSFDESAIEALYLRKIDGAIKLYKSGILNLDEARGLVGWEEVKGGGGDTFYLPSNLIPIGSDGYTQDQRDTPKKSVDKAEYIRLMTSIKDVKGQRLYSDDFIKKNVEIYYN